MFSVATPLMSSRPRPPTPMQAMLSVSLGARNPRPSTCRGTMVNATAAPASPTNVRREMRLRAMMGASSVGCGRLRRARGSEQDGEQHENREGHRRRIHPDAWPIVRHGSPSARAGEGAYHPTRHPGADRIADAVRDDVDHPLRGSADPLARPLVGVDLAGHEEEIVAGAMPQGPGGEKPEPAGDVVVAERALALRPSYLCAGHDGR